mmetsp:Transcript_18559/g.70423  ORF Transcript_18559/g.70423 Transcript_18559/m.70423 type:complete len:219 (-) Transcript_18559:6-662(-)
MRGAIGLMLNFCQRWRVDALRAHANIASLSHSTAKGLGNLVGHSSHARAAAGQGGVSVARGRLGGAGTARPGGFGRAAPPGGLFLLLLLLCVQLRDTSTQPQRRGAQQAPWRLRLLASGGDGCFECRFRGFKLAHAEASLALANQVGSLRRVGRQEQLGHGECLVKVFRVHEAVELHSACERRVLGTHRARLSSARHGSSVQQLRKRLVKSVHGGPAA